MAMAAWSALHLSQLDQLHPVSERATNGRNLRRDVSRYHQDISAHGSNVYTADPGIWSAFFHAAQYCCQCKLAVKISNL